MSVEYGVLYGKVVGGKRALEVEQLVRQNGDRNYRSNHFHLLVQAEGGVWRCPVNVRSQDGSEVWFKIRDTFTNHPILQDLPNLPEGLTELPNRRPGRTLDYVREPLFDRTTMRHLPMNAPTENDDVQDHLQLYAAQAQAEEAARVYVFGSFWRNRQFPPDRVLNTNQGVHDVHMNQGNSTRFRGDDGVWQDGGLIFHFPATGRHVGIFLAFNSQVWFTDNQSGHRLPGFPEGPLAGTTVTPPVTPPVPMPSEVPVRIIAALVNPVGDDPGRETVTLYNVGGDQADLAGWKLQDRQNKTEDLTGTHIPPHDSAKVRLTGQGAQLGNRGGTIRLLDAADRLIDTVSYTEAQATSGRTILF